MKKKQKELSGEVEHPGFFRGAEVALTVGNFNCGVKSNMGDSAEDLLLLAWNVYIAALKHDKINDDPGVR